MIKTFNLRLLSFSLFICLFVSAKAESTLTDTIMQLGLPVVIVETKNHEEPTADLAETPQGCWGGTITNATKIEGSVLVVSPQKDTLFNSGEYIKKTSGMTIKLRGNWSARASKKAYKIKLQVDGDMLSRGKDDTYKDKEWALIRESYGDSPQVMLRIMLGMKLSTWMLNSWSPAFQYVNLIMNGDYRGLYVLTELVTRNKSCRINVNKDNGYLVELDPYWWNEDVSVETLLFQDAPVKYTFKHPDSEDVVEDQLTQLGEYLVRVEQSILTNKYDQFIDVNNWARWLIAHDILGTYDASGSNQFFYINNISKDSIVRRGPLWDFDTNYQIQDKWANIHVAENLWYYNQLFKDSTSFTFATAYKTIYQKESPAIFDSIYNLLDSISTSDWKQAMDSSISMDRKRWPNDLCAMDSSIQFTRNWMKQRQLWLDQEVAKIQTSKVVSLSEPIAKEVPVRYVLNGMIIILKNGKYYTIDGRQIDIY